MNKTPIFGIPGNAPTEYDDGNGMKLRQTADLPPGEDTMTHAQPIPGDSDVSEELLPCPFCGGEARIIEGEESAYVQCQNRKMHRALWFDGDNDAANEVREQWNCRFAPTAKLEECATEGCNNAATERFVAGDVGSSYCPSCLAKVQALRSAPTAVVKPLEWVKDAHWAQAFCPIAGMAQVHLSDDKWDWKYGQGNCRAQCETMEEAIAEVEEVRRGRILSCLSAAPTAEPDEAELLKLFHECEKMLGGKGKQYANFAREVLRRYASSYLSSPQEQVAPEPIIEPVAWQMLRKLVDQMEVLLSADDDMPTAKQDYADAEKLLEEAQDLLATTPTADVSVRHALKELLHAVCGETGFANAVRQHSGKAYPWPALDIAEQNARAALSALNLEQANEP